MKQVKWAAFALMLFFSAACQDSEVSPNDVTLTDSDFKTNLDGWTTGYTDYNTAQEEIIEFKSGQAALPAPLDITKKSLMISGHNRSDDLFMFLKKKITGLQPNQTYRLLFEIELASQYADNSFGIGGSPGSSVYLKAGASATEPQKVKQGDEYHLNLDKGQQSVGGKDALLLGNVGTGDDVAGYKLIQRTNREQLMTVKTNAAGELWLLIGTDSGFEGETVLYYNHIRVTATL
jgi:hypothetical protein